MTTLQPISACLLVNSWIGLTLQSDKPESRIAGTGLRLAAAMARTKDPLFASDFELWEIGGFQLYRMGSGNEKCILESDGSIIIGDTDSNLDRNRGATEICMSTLGHKPPATTILLNNLHLQTHPCDDSVKREISITGMERACR